MTSAAGPVARLISVPASAVHRALPLEPNSGNGLSRSPRLQALQRTIEIAASRPWRGLTSAVS